MNYTYIEQLLERYWQGETNLDEEQILKSFFCQDDVPEHLREYAEFFAYAKDSKDMHVSDDFDSRFDELIAAEEGRGAERMKAIRIPFKARLMPFLKAAAVVALTLTVGGAAMRGLMQPEDLRSTDLTPVNYVKADEVKQAIETVQRSMTAKADSITGENKAIDADIKKE
jgi:hypothetical protein